MRLWLLSVLNSEKVVVLQRVLVPKDDIGSRYNLDQLKERDLKYLYDLTRKTQL